MTDVSTVDHAAQVLRRRLVEEARLDAGTSDPATLRYRIATLLMEEALPLADQERATLVDRVVSSTVGLGPLEPLMDDPEVEEVMVNGPGVVHVERRGQIVATDVSFESDEELMHTIERILSPLGRRVDDPRAAPVPLQATRESSAHRRIGLGEHKLGDFVGIVRNVQPGPGADLDNPPTGVTHEHASPAAHACQLPQPHKRVVHPGHNPQPRSRRRARLKFHAGGVCHAANVRPAAP